jgi:hypothetical protein
MPSLCSDRAILILESSMFLPAFHPNSFKESCILSKSSITRVLFEAFKKCSISIEAISKLEGFAFKTIIFLFLIVLPILKYYEYWRHLCFDISHFQKKRGGKAQEDEEEKKDVDLIHDDPFSLTLRSHRLEGTSTGGFHEHKLEQRLHLTPDKPYVHLQQPHRDAVLYAGLIPLRAQAHRLLSSSLWLVIVADKDDEE